MDRVPDVRAPRRPIAIGFIRADISGVDEARHTGDVRRLAQQLGYRLIYTIRLRKDSVAEPIEHVLGIADGIRAAAVFVPDLAHVGNRPGPVCDVCDLITVYPEQTWAAAASDIGSGCGSAPRPATPRQLSDTATAGRHEDPGRGLTVAEAHRIMQEHRTCGVLGCLRRPPRWPR